MPENNPSDAYEALKKQGDEALAQGDLQRALAVYQQALETAPHNPEAYNELAKVYGSLGQTNEAKKLYEKAIEIDETYWKAFNNLSNLYRNEGNLSQARQYAEIAFNLQPNNPIVHHTLAMVYNSLQEGEKAEFHYKKSIELNSKNTVELEFGALRSRYNYARFLFYQERFDESFALFKEIVNTPPEILKTLEIEVYCYLGILYFKGQENTRQGIKIFEKLLLLNAVQQKLKEEALYVVYHYLTQACSDLEDYEKSKLYFQKCSELNLGGDQKPVDFLDWLKKV